MTRWILQLAIVLAACTPAPAPAPATQTTPAPPVTYYVVQPVQAAPAVPRKNQPAHTKLELGHYTDGTIGVVIDRTEKTENVADIDPIKVRFDGETTIWKLEGEQAPFGRIDYVRDDGHVMVHMYPHDRFSIYVPDPDGEKGSDEIWLRRDADADPL